MSFPVALHFQKKRNCCGLQVLFSMKIMPQVLATTVNFSHSLVIVNSMGIFQLATVTNISNLCTAVRFASLRNPLVSSIGKKKVGRAFQHLAKTHPLVEACSQEMFFDRCSKLK